MLAVSSRLLLWRDQQARQLPWLETVSPHMCAVTLLKGIGPSLSPRDGPLTYEGALAPATEKWGAATWVSGLLARNSGSSRPREAKSKKQADRRCGGS